MDAGGFDERELFRAIRRSGVRAVLIGRRAMIVLGLPVLTGDYDFWIHIDDIEALNAALGPLDLVPNRNADEARTRGRYVLEGDERVDVLVARRVSTVDATPVLFDEVWARRRRVDVAGATIDVPSLDDLIATKRFATRFKDLQDLKLLEALREKKP